MQSQRCHVPQVENHWTFLSGLFDSISSPLTQLLPLPRGSLPNVHLAILFPTWRKPASALLLSCWWPFVALAIHFLEKVSQSLQAMILGASWALACVPPVLSTLTELLRHGPSLAHPPPSSFELCLSTIPKSSLNRVPLPDLFLCPRHLCPYPYLAGLWLSPLTLQMTLGWSLCSRQAVITSPRLLSPAGQCFLFIFLSRPQNPESTKHSLSSQDTECLLQCYT